MLPTLRLANQRAAAFAKQHGLTFQTAEIRASLHSSRPANMLLMECDLMMDTKKVQLCNFILRKDRKG